MGQLTPLIILENDKAPAIDLSSPAQYTPRVVMHPLAIYSMASKELSEHHEYCIPEDAGLSMSSGSDQYCDSYRSMENVHQDPDFHAQTSHFPSHSNIPRSTAFDLAGHTEPLIPLHAPFTTTPQPPASTQPLTIFKSDSMEGPAYHSGDVWGLPNQHPPSSGDSFPVYLQTTHPMDFLAQQHWYSGASSSTTSTSFGNGGQYPLPLSTDHLTISGTGTDFASPDPYHEDYSMGRGRWR